MKVEYKGKVYETKLNKYGHTVSIDDRMLFARKDGVLFPECKKVEPKVEPEEE